MTAADEAHRRLQFLKPNVTMRSASGDRDKRGTPSGARDRRRRRRHRRAAAQPAHRRRRAAVREGEPAARGWTVARNTFRGIYCENGLLAEHAIRFWDLSRDTVVERNFVFDCARGVGFGLGQTGSASRVYADDPYPGAGYIGHYDGIVDNNVIEAGVPYYDTGIALEQARGARVYHNTIVQPQAAFSSIDYRFANSIVDVRNNLVRNLTQRDGATGTVSSNLMTGSTALFVDAAGLDFHLVAGHRRR
jgi:hypothetical protein